MTFRNLKLYLITVSLSINIISCSSTKKVPFNTSTVTPAAEGIIKVKKDKNNNYQLDISVDNLADPKKLTPAKNAYIVWMETANGTKKVGQINSTSSMFSKAKKGSVSTVSPVKPVRVFISAEDDPNTENPGPLVVLTTNSF